MRARASERFGDSFVDLTRSEPIAAWLTGCTECDNSQRVRSSSPFVKRSGRSARQ